MFGVKVSMEVSSCALVIGKLYLFKRLSILHMHVHILFYDVSPMKISFQMLVFWLSKSLGF
jgi:hypothetical protein